METGLIIIDELLQKSDIEPSFIVLLKNEGLIDITIIEGKQYIHESQLGDLQRFATWYYDLSVNIEGIDVIRNLLDKMRDMERELYILRRRIGYDSRHWLDYDDFDFR